MKAEVLADIYEALEKMKHWKPVYESLLKVCKTKEEAIEALQALIDVDDKDEI